MRGSIVVNGVIFKLIDLRLHDGIKTWVGRRHGPIPDFPGGVTDVRIFGDDGIAIEQVRVEVGAWRDVLPGTSVTIEFPTKNVAMEPAEGTEGEVWTTSL